jgi:hypothetical protein
MRRSKYEKEEDRDNAYDFERFAALLFDRRYFTMLKGPMHYDDQSRLRTPEERNYPDLKFCEKKTDTYFWVECKHRENLFDNHQWCRKKILLDYYDMAEKEAEVFVMLGFGGTGKDPELVSCVRYKHVSMGEKVTRGRYIYDHVILKYEIPNGKQFTSLQQLHEHCYRN